MRFNSSRALVLVSFSFLVGPGGIQAQDIELYGKIHGTRPPQAYYDLMERDPGAFQFRRALKRRGLRIRELPDVRSHGRVLSAAYDEAFVRLLAEGPSRAPVVSGVFSFPLILGLFQDSPPVLAAYEREAVQAEFFDGPQANPQAVGTIPDFYDEISGGRVTLTGTTFDWREIPLTQFEVAAGQSGLGPGSRVGEFIVRILEGLDDGSVDWGQFDNDGLDGIPNSGDDDGYVDVLAIMHPTPGAECSTGDRANRIWSHRWTLFDNAQNYGSAWTPSITESILANNGYVTQSPSANSDMEYVKVLDYTIQPVQRCSGDAINYIGVFAHELGHGFGLPDLYVTSRSQYHEGIGNWGLMGTGSWGCDGHSAWSPCHMSAWSKEFLGWADVEVLDPDTDLGTLSLPPVESSGDIYRINSGDGSEEYLLLENRQKTLFDQHLYEQGLLIWHIDPVTVQNPPGGINNDPNRMGVWLRQADGLNELGTADGGRGNDGDPFPGLTGNTAFHAGSDPDSWTHDGAAMGITILDIQQVGEAMTFRALTRYQTLTFRTEGSPSGTGLVSVDNLTQGASDWDLPSAPFQNHLIQAAPGEVVEDGVRVAFQDWADGAPRVREYTTQLEDASFTALYGGEEFYVDVEPTSSVFGVVPGTIAFSGGDGAGWVPSGDPVTVTATPRTGFEFHRWGGVLESLPNPASFTVTEPVQTQAYFDVTFSAQGNPASVTLEGGFQHELTLLVENANLPVNWSLISGTLPSEMMLTGSGSIQGTPVQGGTFSVTLRVQDAIGIPAVLPLTLVVEDPEIPLASLASAFLRDGPPLNADTRKYLDNEGNGNNTYDFGDFRAYVLRNPDVESFSQAAPVVEILVPMGTLKNSPPGGEVKREEGP